MYVYTSLQYLTQLLCTKHALEDEFKRSKAPHVLNVDTPFRILLDVFLDKLYSYYYIKKVFEYAWNVTITIIIWKIVWTLSKSKSRQVNSSDVDRSAICSIFRSLERKFSKNSARDPIVSENYRKIPLAIRSWAKNSDRDQIVSEKFRSRSDRERKIFKKIARDRIAERRAGSAIRSVNKLKNWKKWNFLKKDSNLK